MFKKYISRLTSSERGERFNPLIPPFLLATFSYGLAFLFFSGTDIVSTSSLYISMIALHSFIPVLWGLVAVITIVVGGTFLLFNIPPAGKISGLLGFMLWIFAVFCWVFSGSWVQLLAVGLPNLWFWFWQYLSLSVFRAEEEYDRAVMDAYRRGEYDTPKGGKELREGNRGADEQ